MGRRSKPAGPWRLESVQFSATGRLTRCRVLDPKGKPVKLSRPRAAQVAVLGSRLVALLRQIEDGAFFHWAMLHSEHPGMARPVWLDQVAELRHLAERAGLI